MIGDKNRFGRGRPAAVAAVIFIVLAALGVFYLRRDLDLRRVISTDNLPDIVVENLDFRRVIDGRDWRVTAKTAAHDSGLITANSIDIFVAEGDSGEAARFYAGSGEFAEKTDDVVLYSVRGALTARGRSLDVLAPRADYSNANKIWTLSGGVSLQDNEAKLKGETAKISLEGVVSIDTEVEARWKIRR
ncbi:MAG: LPS export ABC transporter periplasmic protein LptC [Synergistaceae bacterium]|nr:LPS export ABC transporter periplasmic protein LptC [Synergistaceae bacterium]